MQESAPFRRGRIPCKDASDVPGVKHGRRIYQPGDADVRICGIHPRLRIFRQSDHGKARPGQGAGLYQLLDNPWRCLLKSCLRQAP